MSKCTLSIELDSSTARSLRPGDPIRGEVVVKALEDLSCKTLSIALVSAARTGRHTDRRPISQTVEHDLQWLAGQQTRHAFCFTAHERPLGYPGQLVEVVQQVHVQLDIPWGLDATASEDFTVQPGPHSRAVYLGRRDASTPQAEAEESRRTAWDWVSSALVYLGLLSVLPVLIILFVPILIGTKIYDRLMMGQLGKVVVSLDAPLTGKAPRAGIAGKVQQLEILDQDRQYAITPGRDFRVRIRFSPPRGQEIERISATLVGQEINLPRKSSSGIAKTHSLCEQRLVLGAERFYLPRERVDLSGSLVAPKLPAYSFEGNRNHIRWWVEVEIELPDPPNWKEKIELIMLPAETAFSQAQPSSPTPTTAGPDPSPVSATEP